MRNNIDTLDDAIKLDSREKIFSIIGENPGLHFREVQRRAEIATGALQYHLDYLKKKHLIREEKVGKFSRFYSIRAPEINTQLMSLLRQESVRAIVLFLMKRRRATLPQIAKEITLSVSTTGFHLQKLLESQVVLEKKYGRKNYYFLANKDAVLEMFVTYKDSFLDTLVDSFVDLWEKELVR